MVRKRILENGVTLLLDPVATTETVSIGFWFPHGSRDERLVQGSENGSHGERGFSHFLEHLLFKGTRKRSAFQIAKEIDRVGGVLNAFTEKENTCFYSTLPARHLSLAVDVLSDMVFNSLLDPGEIEKEKSVVINEILGYMDSPEEMAHESYMQCFWGGHPLALKVTGDISDIKAIGEERLDLFYRKRYSPANLVISIAGKFDLNSAVDTISAAVGSFRGARFSVSRTVPVKKLSWEHRKDRFKQVNIYAGTDLPLFGSSHQVLYDAQVFSNAVGESMSSRLFQEIRERRALCYSISCFRTLYTDISLWTIYTNTTPIQVRELVEALGKELKNLKANPLEEEEIEDAKSYLKGNLILSKEDMEVRMKRLMRLNCLTGKVIEYEESFDFLDRVNSEGVARITDQVVGRNRFNLMAYGSRRIRNFKDLGFDF